MRLRVAKSLNLEVHHAGARRERHADRRKKVSLEPALGGVACHLHGKNGRDDAPLDRVIFRWMSAPEALHQHCLSHTAIGLDGNAGHPRGARLDQQRLEHLEREAGPRVGDPPLFTDGLDPLCIGRVQHDSGGRREVGMIKT